MTIKTYTFEDGKYTVDRDTDTGLIKDIRRHGELWPAGMEGFQFANMFHAVLNRLDELEQEQVLMAPDALCTTIAPKAPAMNKWQLETNPMLRRRTGKTAEECNELAQVCVRIDLQGIDGVNPKTGKTNRQEWIEEMADVQAQLTCNLPMLTTDEYRALQQRTVEKIAQMHEWESLYRGD